MLDVGKLEPEERKGIKPPRKVPLQDAAPPSSQLPLFPPPSYILPATLYRGFQQSTAPHFQREVQIRSRYNTIHSQS